MGKVFSINTIGPALIAKNFIPLLNKEKKSFLDFYLHVLEAFLITGWVAGILIGLQSLLLI